MADVFEVLKQDHDEVNRLLPQLHSGPTALTGATGNQLGARNNLTDQLIAMTSRHAPARPVESEIVEEHLRE